MLQNAHTSQSFASAALLVRTPGVLVKKDSKHEYLAFSTEDVVQSKASGKRAGLAAPTEPRGPTDPLSVLLQDVRMHAYSNRLEFALI
jgi:hypothetical protein